MSNRYELMRHWLKEVLGDRPVTITPASNDASFRRYWRVSGDRGTKIVMDAPPDKEDCGPYLKVANELLRAGLNVPMIYAQDLQQGFLLLSDFGTELYLSALNPHNVEPLYGDALDALFLMQTRADREAVPPYDRSLLLTEMALFRDWLVTKELQIALTPEQDQALTKTYDRLADNALAQPQVFVHRDYHSRNLMIVPSCNPGILDFQDAVAGPITYDLVSLLRDCYVKWPQEQVESWALRYYERAKRAKLTGTADALGFLRWFDLMGVQRHLKASGIFARLWHRDGKDGYLAEVPRTLSYITDVGTRYAELESLIELLTLHVLPALSQRDYA